MASKLSVVVRKQRNDIYTVIYRQDGSLPDDGSVDPDYHDGICIFGLAGNLGLSLLLGTDVEHLHSLPVGNTMAVELTARRLDKSSNQAMKRFKFAAQFLFWAGVIKVPPIYWLINQARRLYG